MINSICKVNSNVKFINCNITKKTFKETVMSISKDDMINELVEYDLEHLTMSEVINMIGTFLSLGYGELDDEELQERYDTLGAGDHAIH